MADTAFAPRTGTYAADTMESDRLPDRRAADADLLTTMRDQFRRAEDREYAYRLEALDDLRFRAGQQWDPKEKKRRADKGRPCLTINTAPQYERQILNEQRQNRPAIKVRPVGNGADVKVAQVYQGIIRHIEQRSHVDQADDTAYEGAVRHGRGYFRLRLQYSSPMSFDQEILIERIRNPFMVYMDYGCQLPTYADARWAFLFEQVSKAQHKAEYGISTEELVSWSSLGDSWIFEDDVRVAEYWYKESDQRTLGQFRDGTTEILEPILLGVADMITDPEPVEAFVEAFLRPIRQERPLAVLRQRLRACEGLLAPLGEQFTTWYLANLTDLLTQLVQIRPTAFERIRHVKTNGHCILEESLWPGKWIPIIPVLGDEMDIDNEVMLSGYIRHAKDPMRMKNYWVTMQAEHVALSPVAPWLVADGQIEAYEDDWKVANREPKAYLTYRPLDNNGNPVPPPIRNAFEPPVQGLTIAMQGSEHDTQATIGMYPPSLGEGSKEKSGKAILARDQQTDTGTFHYGDNLRRAIEFRGEQLVDLIPKVLSPQTVQRILGEDGSAKMVMLQEGAAPGTPPPPDVQGIEGVYDIWAGTYDVVVDVGPSYATKRQEALETLVNLTEKNPKLGELAGDILVRNVDADGMEELERRYKKTLPPELMDEEEGKTTPETQVIQLQAQLQQVGQELEALNAYIQACEQQTQQLQQDNAALKQETALKEQDLVLQSRKMDLEMQLKRFVETEKLAIERQKVAILEEANDLKALELGIKREVALAQAEAPQEDTDGE